MAKPTVNVAPNAQNYAAANERIIEVGNGRRGMDTHQGALISVRTLDDGTLVIDVYRMDGGVRVNVGKPDDAPGHERAQRFWVVARGLGDGEYGPFDTEDEAEQFIDDSDLLNTQTHTVERR